MNTMERIERDRKAKAEKFAKAMARPPGDWIDRLLCRLAGGHRGSWANFEGQYARHVSEELFYYGKCPRCGWHVYYDGYLRKWYDGESAPMDIPMRDPPPLPADPIPPSWM